MKSTTEFHVGWKVNGEQGALIIHAHFFIRPGWDNLLECTQPLMTENRAKALVAALRRREYRAHRRGYFISFDEVPLGELERICRRLAIDYDRLRQCLWWSRFDGEHYQPRVHLK